MQEFPEYPEIEGLHKQTEILNLTCTVQEKIHGSCTRLSWNNKYGLLLGSRHQIIYKDGIHGSHYGFTQWALDNLSERLQEAKVYYDFVFYGEWFGKGIQKGIDYCQEKELRIFDIRMPNEDFLPFQEVRAICENLDLLTVPEVLYGKVTLADLEQIRDKPSIVSQTNGFDDTNIWEGVVIKANPPCRDKHGEWMMAKYKSHKWAENTKNSTPKDVDPEKLALWEKAKLFAEENVTLGRISTVKDHITRGDNPLVTMSRTSEFLRELVKDIMKDNEESYRGLTKDQANIYNKAVSSAGSLAWKKLVEEDDGKI